MRSFAVLTCLTLAAIVFGLTSTTSAASQDPFSRLFLTPEQRANDQPRGLKQQPTVIAGLPAAPAVGATPRIECGTKILPVSPEFDAKIRRPAPLDPKPSVRSMPAPSCQQVK